MMKKIIFSSVLILIFLSCKKEYSLVKGTSNLNTTILSSLPLADSILISDTTLFYDCEFGGKRQLQIVGLNNCISFSGGNGLPYGDNTKGYGAYDFNFFANDSLSALTFRRGNIILLPTDTSYLLQNQRMFHGFVPGNYSYTQNPVINSGVMIERFDSTGKFWSTRLGTADQSSSSFQILKEFNIDPQYSSTGITHYIYIRCQFNCTLYDGKGNKIEVTNGKLGLSIWL